MCRPLATRDELLEELADEDDRIYLLRSAHPVSPEAALRRAEGLALARVRKAGLLADLAMLDAREKVA